MYIALSQRGRAPYVPTCPSHFISSERMKIQIRSPHHIEDCCLINKSESESEYVRIAFKFGLLELDISRQTTRKVRVSLTLQVRAQIDHG